MESSNIMETLTEDQQMQVFNLMSLANIDDMNLAAQVYVDSDFDLNVKPIR